MKRWQLQEAKARLSEVVKSSERGPQAITIHGREAAVVLSMREYDRLRRPKVSFLEFLRKSPLAGVSLRLHRDRAPVRDIPL